MPVDASNFAVCVADRDAQAVQANPLLNTLIFQWHDADGMHSRETDVQLQQSVVAGYHQAKWSGPFPRADYARQHNCTKVDGRLQCVAGKPWVATELPEPGLGISLLIISVCLVLLHWFDLWRIGGGKR